MAKHTLTATGMKVTKTGRIMYHTPYKPHDPNHIMSKEGNDINVGDKVWEWSYGSRLGMKTVGIVIRRTPKLNPGDDGFMEANKFEIESLNGDLKTIWPSDTIKLTDDEYAEIVAHFKNGGK